MTYTVTGWTKEYDVVGSSVACSSLETAMMVRVGNAYHYDIHEEYQGRHYLKAQKYGRKEWKIRNVEYWND